ncbi:hypothetical protein JCM6882_001203 [Rhodosporidiobolus microsporus]
MSRPPPLLLNGAAPPPTPAQQQLDALHQQLDDALNIANGARAVLVRVQEEGEHPELLPSALEEELAKAEEEIPVLQERIRRLELEMAAAVPAPLSPAPAPPSATANGFGAVSSPMPSYLSSDTSANGFGLASSPLPHPDSDLLSAMDTACRILGRLGEMNSVGERVRGMDAVVEAVERCPAVKYDLRLEEWLPSITACLSELAGKETRAAVYRLLRHLVVDASDAAHLNAHHVPLFLIRSLARDTPFLLEKEHALRLIRALLPFATPATTLSGASEHEVLPVGVVRAVVAIAETVEEKLRLAALETLGEMVVINLPLLTLTNGLRVVLQSLLEGPYELSPPLSLLFLPAVDHPASRQWLRPGVDVEVVLAGFTEVQPKGAGGEERVKACARIVGAWLKSWSGLFYLNIHGRQALTSLVDSLTNPSQTIRETLLDMLFSVFNVKCPASTGGHRPSFSGLNGIDGAESSYLSGRSPGTGGEERKTNLLDQYMAILLLVFIEAGLVEALTSLAADPKDPVAGKKVSLLISELLELGNRVLPPQHAVRLQALPKLFALTSSFDASDARLAASEALLAVGVHGRNRRVGQLRKAVVAEEEGRARSNSLEDTLARSSTLSQASQVATTKLRSALQMDDLTFRNLLLATGVLSTKDHTKWQLDTLFEVVEGPLKNAKRLDEAMRATKFCRRLLGFFQPFSGRYGEIRKSEPGADRWTRLGCTLLETLAANPDGVQFLHEDKLLRYISDGLFQLDPQLGSSNGVDTLFSKERLEQTLSSGYFEMLGVLTRTAAGVRILDSLKVFTAFYRISELRSRDDLVKLIIENLDYSLDGHPRVFLSKALTSSYKHIRLFATRHLATLLRHSTSSGTSPCPFSATWQVALLVQQLYDSAPEVVHFAVHVLEDLCQEKETLEMVVGMRPALDLLGEVAQGLLTRFLSAECGVRYLHEIDFIERELDDWFNERNVLYVVELELALASVLGTDGGLQEPSSTFDGTPPSHFYGELVKTAEGCDILRDSGHFDSFVDVIEQHGESDLDEAYVMTLKSVLWAVGHIGSTPDGLGLLDDEGLLADLVQIAAFSPVYTLRGTATFALALISQTEEGAELLDELGWESVWTPIRGPTGICVPTYLGDYIYTPLWDPPLLDMPTSLQLASATSHIEREALAALANLSNHILATKASKALARLKTRHRSLFSSPSLFYRALDMLASHHYRLATRKYVLELFDLPLDSGVADRIMQAGEDLKARKRAEMESDGAFSNGVDGEPSPGGADEATPEKPRWAASGVETILNTGMGDEVTEDDDESSIEEGETTIPLQVLTPLVTVKGFLLA